eukprot:GHVS01022906.1.p1 GENE.GHVS01022906.1~~GHVS01022906.1.p1  ORF type:complete len:520 (-),score=119.82 GHVS01022906.1:137-1696(-)
MSRLVCDYDELENAELQEVARIEKHKKTKAAKGNFYGRQTDQDDEDDGVAAGGVGGVAGERPLLKQYDDWEEEQKEMKGLGICGNNKGFYLKRPLEKNELELDPEAKLTILTAQQNAQQPPHLANTGWGVGREGRYIYYSGGTAPKTQPGEEVEVEEVILRSRKNPAGQQKGGTARKRRRGGKNDEMLETGNMGENFWDEMFGGKEDPTQTVQRERLRQLTEDNEAVDGRAAQTGEEHVKAMITKLEEIKDEMHNNNNYSDYIKIEQLDDVEEEQSGVIVPKTTKSMQKTTGSANTSRRRLEAADEADTDGMDLTSTTEFCRTVQTPLEKLEELKADMPMDSPMTAVQVSTKPLKHSNKKQDKNDEEGEEGEEESSSDEEDDEPDRSAEGLMPDNLAGALEYLKGKGDLLASGLSPGQYAKRKESQPLHMSTVKGDIKLDYKDSYGRVMTPKEAFQHISWIFHGKGPGRKKTEKKLKKMEIEKSLMQNPIESLPTFRALKRNQAQEGKAHLVLTGNVSK